jgi:hypothetical protein
MIRFVTSIAFANESELGWDPTIQRERITEQVHSSPGGSSLEPEREQVAATRYRITVHTRPVEDDGHERTRIIFDYGADALRGRGTRVFEARRLEDNVEVGEPVVIKDVWVDDDREREDRILSQLLNDADDKDKELVKKYFLTVLTCGYVIISGKVDHTRDLITRGQDIPRGHKFRLPAKALDPRPKRVVDNGGKCSKKRATKGKQRATSISSFANLNIFVRTNVAHMFLVSCISNPRVNLQFASSILPTGFRAPRELNTYSASKSYIVFTCVELFCRLIQTSLTRRPRKYQYHSPLIIYVPPVAR